MWQARVGDGPRAATGEEAFGAEVDRVFAPGLAHAPVPAEPHDFEPLHRSIPLTWQVRHLPTPEALAAVREAHGDAADGLLARWAAAWASTGIDLAALAPRPNPRAAVEWMELVMAVDARAPQLPRAPDEDVALRLVSGLDEPVAVPRRTLAAHVLEDAARAVALIGAPMPVVLALHGVGGRVVVRRRADGVWVARRVTHATWARIQAGLEVPSAFWLTGAFAAHAGRPSLVADGQASACLALLALARAGWRGAFLKDAAFKGGTWAVDLAGATDLDGAMAAMRRAMGTRFFTHFAPSRVAHRRPRRDRDPLGLAAWSLGAWGSAPALLVQGLTPFVAEHRFLVVDDAIVASTPSDRALAVLDAHRGPGRLDPRVAVLEAPSAPRCGPYDRGLQRTVGDRALVARMAQVARGFARAFARDRDADVLWELGAVDPVAYALDVGLGDDGVVRVIEANQFRFAGTYAADPERFVPALWRRPWGAPARDDVAGEGEPTEREWRARAAAMLRAAAERRGGVAGVR